MILFLFLPCELLLGPDHNLKTCSTILHFLTSNSHNFSIIKTHTILFFLKRLRPESVGRANWPGTLSCALANDDPPLPHYPHSTFKEKFEGTASISKQKWLDKKGGCAACRRIGSETRDGEGWWGVLDKIRETIWTNSRAMFIWNGWQQPRLCASRWKDRTEMECWTVTACKRDEYVALLPISLHPTAQVLWQDLSSKEME